MCGIVDANVAGKLFGDPRNSFETAKRFLEHVRNKKMTLVIGGKLTEEISKVEAAKQWFHTALDAGRAYRVPDNAISAATEELDESDLCRSDDLHVLALARESGARLLYTNDKNLIDDFGDREIINSPRGKVYTDRQGGKFTSRHRGLLQKNVCAK